jgi:anhydro-N-acetylmuramic acid kinase
MDGIDTVLVRFDDHDLDLVATLQFDYPDALRQRLVAASRRPEDCGVDELGELNTWVGECFRDAALAILKKADRHASDIAAIGSHGQTIRHRPDLRHPFSLQIGDPAIIAAGTGIQTVADFRLADLALGGEGAPLAPAFHQWLMQDKSDDTVVVNIGGMANITVISSDADKCTGFDTGPGNTLLDAWIDRQQGRPYDAGGSWAASGQVSSALLERLLADPYFSAAPPKSTGFEYFNLDWLEDSISTELAAADVQATLLELSAITIASAIRTCAPGTRTVYVCGGGAHNPLLIDRIDQHLPAANIESSAAAGLDPDWVEAVAFAWLAMRRLQGLPGNLPSVTGASRDAILGAVFAS